ncbi:MAG: type I methionyl aminopeptidase [Phycisphaerae bacterium]|nr:type I methionyl aminopeptidase [Phycisphaerae bacterium]
MASLPLVIGRDIDAARAAARRVVETHRALSRWLRPGQTLAEIDRFVAKTLDEMGARSCFLGYKVPRSPAFPSHACLSVNDCVVHGTAASHLPPLVAGDVLKIDIGVFFEGWVGDAAWTYCFGPPSPTVKALMDCGKEALRRGVHQLQPGRPYIEWARTVQGYVESPPPEGCGFHLIRGLGGHGYGRRLHGPPFVSNVVPAHIGEWPDALTPARVGTLLAVEPMIAVGTGKTIQRKNQWPIYTADRSCSVHYEHDVLIGEHGPVVLTEGLEETPDVVAV